MNSNFLSSSIGASNSLPGLAAYNILRNCNYFLEPPGQQPHLKGFSESNCRKFSDFGLVFSPQNEPSLAKYPPSGLLPYPHSISRVFTRSPLGFENALSPTLSNCGTRKQRNEKRPIPDEQKDDKYFERRRRNNQAAKKSRDARKLREDQIALRASILEHENAILRAQVLTLREEASSLRQMLLHRKSFDIAPPSAPLCVITK